MWVINMPNSEAKNKRGTKFQIEKPGMDKYNNNNITNTHTPPTNLAPPICR